MTAEKAMEIVASRSRGDCEVKPREATPRDERYGGGWNVLATVIWRNPTAFGKYLYHVEADGTCRGGSMVA